MPPPLPPHLRHLLPLRRHVHHIIRPPLPSVRFLSIYNPPTPTSISPLVQSVSSALLRHSPSDPLPISDNFFSLHFSDVHFNTSLLADVLRLSPSAGRSALHLFRWLVHHRNFSPNDDSLSNLVAHFARRHDFHSVRDLLVEFRRGIGPNTFREAVTRLARAGRPADVTEFFRIMESDYGIRQDRPAMVTVVSALCEHGHGREAEELVREWRDRIFPDEEICHLLVRGWCVDGRIDEAIRLIGEMRRGGFEVGAPGYNAVLDCVCRLSRKKDPLRMMEEAEKVLVEMEVRGIPRDTETFRVLIANLCKIRKTEDAMRIFNQMSEWGCSPDAEIYLTLIRSLYQAARISEGDEMVVRMWLAGFKAELDTKECYGFLKILCGIERVEHALKVFKMLKKHGFKPGVQTYELLMQKLCAHNLVDKANALFRQGKALGLPVTPKEYTVDPRYVEKLKEGKKKRRLTLPEKILMKRKRLKKLRLSFVKKPRKRRAY